MVSLRRGHHADAVRITTAPESPESDMAHRQKRYMISMGIRTLCFIGAIAVGQGWLRWVLVAGAFVLPYIAVVMANAVRPRNEGSSAPVTPRDEGPDQIER